MLSDLLLRIRPYGVELSINTSMYLLSISLARPLGYSKVLPSLDGGCSVSPTRNSQRLNHFRWHFLSNSALDHFWEISAQVITQSCSQPYTGLCKGNTGSASGTVTPKAPPWRTLPREHCGAAGHKHLICVCGRHTACGRRTRSLSTRAHPESVQPAHRRERPSGGASLPGFCG